MPVNKHLLKPKIYNFVKQHKATFPVYKLNMLLNKHGHTVLRLPPYYPELNPIEKIRVQVKQWVAVPNVKSQIMTRLMKFDKRGI